MHLYQYVPVRNCIFPNDSYLEQDEIHSALRLSRKTNGAEPKLNTAIFDHCLFKCHGFFKERGVSKHSGAFR
jgi:hypothetical protein